jgi:hypothetical protein
VHGVLCVSTKSTVVACLPALHFSQLCRELVPGDPKALSKLINTARSTAASTARTATGSSTGSSSGSATGSGTGDIQAELGAGDATALEQSERIRRVHEIARKILGEADPSPATLQHRVPSPSRVAHTTGSTLSLGPYTLVFGGAERLKELAADELLVFNRSNNPVLDGGSGDGGMLQVSLLSNQWSCRGRVM